VDNLRSAQAAPEQDREGSEHQKADRTIAEPDEDRGLDRPRQRGIQNTFSAKRQ
jgi:hypothetical protein